MLVNRRKVAGVLAEAERRHRRPGNRPERQPVTRAAPGRRKVAAGSLLTTDGVRRERAPILADLLLRLEQAYDRWREGGLDAIYDGLGARDFLRGRRVFVDGETGSGSPSTAAAGSRSRSTASAGSSRAARSSSSARRTRPATVDDRTLRLSPASVATIRTTLARTGRRIDTFAGADA